MHKHTSIICLVLTALASSCVASCDSVLMVKGRFVDQNCNPYKSCNLTVKYGREVIGESKVLGGTFEKTYVFGGVGWSALAVVGSCAGSKDSYQTTIDKLPQKLEPIDLGNIILKSRSVPKLRRACKPQHADG